MEDKIFDIVTDLIRDDISKNEAIDKLLYLHSVSKRFIIEVFLNDRRLEYRASNNETDIDKELIELKRTYKSNNCVFYKGELNVC
jgi:hypothetical protein